MSRCTVSDQINVSLGPRLIRLTAVGPVMEAFGYQRIIFGSSPSPASESASLAGNWYELARESLAELGVEQEFIDAVFCLNAQKVYGS